MIPVETAVPFFIASLLLGLAPGPDNLFVLTQSVINGRASGLLVVLGLCSGLVVHTTAVALGVAVIFQTSDAAFTLLKVAGVCYLLYLAWSSFRFRPREIGHPRRGSGEGKRAGLYGRGIIMNVTNPKVSLFFLAFLPHFADPARGSMAVQMITLGGLFILATVIVFGSIAVFGGTLGERLKGSEKTQLILNRMAGVIFIALAVTLVIN